MFLLIKKFFREFKINFTQILTISIIISIGIAFFSGLTYTYNNLNETVKNYYKTSNLSDIYIYGNNISSSNFKEISKTPGVDNINGRIQILGTIDSSELIINGYSKDNSINKVKLLSGHRPKKNEIAIDSRYLKENNLNIGDKIDISINGTKYNFRISGSIKSSEYLYSVKDSSQPVPNHKLYGYSIVSQEYLENLTSITYNQLLIKSDNTNLSKVKNNILRKYSNYTGITKKDNPSYAMFRTKLDTVKSMSTILPLVFSILAILITMISMSRQVENQRSQIAILKALGCSNKLIISFFLITPFIISVIGTTFGVILGTIIFPKLLVQTLGILFDFPNISTTNVIPIILLSFIITLSIESISSILSCRKILKEKPAISLRPKAPKKVSHSILENIPNFWNKLSYENKLVIHNISINKRRFFMSSVGIIFSICIMIASFGLKFALIDIIKTEFTSIRHYDISATLNKPILYTQKYSNISSVKSIDYFSMTQAQIKSKTTKLNILNKNSTSMKLFDNNSKQIDISNSNGIYISNKLAKELNLKKGDSINLAITLPNKNKTIINAKITGTYESYTSQGIYTTFEYLSNKGVDLPVTNLLIQSSNLIKTKKSLSNDSDVSMFTIKNNQKSDYNDASESINEMVLLMIISSALLLFTVVYNIGTINIFERNRDIATEKVLGLKNSEINSLVLKENLVLILFSAIVGTLLSFDSYSLLCNGLAPEDMAFPEHLNLLSIPLALILTLIFLFFTNIFLKQKIKKIDMLDSLKSVE